MRRPCRPRCLATACISLSRPGRLSRPLAPLMPWSLKTATTCQPWRLATACSSRSWLRVVWLFAVLSPNVQGNPLGHSSFRAHGIYLPCNTRMLYHKRLIVEQQKRPIHALISLAFFKLRTQGFLVQRRDALTGLFGRPAAKAHLQRAAPSAWLGPSYRVAYRCSAIWLTSDHTDASLFAPSFVPPPLRRRAHCTPSIDGWSLPASRTAYRPA